MSKLITKDGTYFIAPYNESDILKPFDLFMEESFTIYVKCKIFPDKIGYDPSFLFSRNGKHSGIYVIKQDDDTILINYTYWFIDENNENKQIILAHLIPEEIIENSNEYMMICDQETKKIECYVNQDCVGVIDFENMTKESYKGTFVWVGCGSVFIDEKYQNFGEFEYDMMFGLSKNLDLEDISYLKKNYEIHTNIIGDVLPVFNKSVPNRKELHFFFDFKNETKYKIWNIAFNGHYLQSYIENNILY